MATPAQITANRANAQKSTGPRSVEGKSASRFNALKHGIDAASIVIPGEDPAEYESLVAQYLEEYRPRSASEFFHVETMIRADWHKRRLETVEADLYRTIMSESPDNSLAAVLLAESPAAKLLLRIQRQIAAFERTWHRANNEFRRARAEGGTAAEASPEASLDPRRIGFVPPIRRSRPPASPAAPAATRNWPPIDEKTGKAPLSSSAEPRNSALPLNWSRTMEAAEAGSVAVLAEKPSVARDIARVLGAGTKGNGYLHGNGYVVTWAIGHLAALAQPHEINPDWRQWRRQSLPMLPRAMAARGLREDQGPVRDREAHSQLAQSLAQSCAPRTPDARAS